MKYKGVKMTYTKFEIKTDSEESFKSGMSKIRLQMAHLGSMKNEIEMIYEELSDIKNETLNCYINNIQATYSYWIPEHLQIKELI